MELKEKRLLREFGLTKEDWLRIYDFQKGICPLCGLKLQRWLAINGHTAAVDHSHSSGIIRGLVHKFPCNRNLGYFKDDPELFRICANYLEHPPAIAALGGPKFTTPGRIGTKKRARLLKEINGRKNGKS